jgi:hypothetical protein
VGAQEEVIPVLRGEVRVGSEPLGEGTVVLHRVSAEASGEIDSISVAADGSFQIRLPYVPNHAARQEVFFASVDFRGLLYFGPAVTEAFQLDSLYLIQAYDTLSVPMGGAVLPVSVRNLFLEKRDEGWDATDLIQLRHDGDRTFYSPQEGVVWSLPLPPGATDFETGQVDMGPEAVRFRNGAMEVYTPLPPGERYFLVRYVIPENEFILPLPGITETLEVLVREPGPPVEFPPLMAGGPVELEPGNVYRTYTGGSFVETEIQALVAPEPWSIPAELVGILLAGLLGAAGVYGYRRGFKGPAPEGDSDSPSRESLLLSIAELDEAFSARDKPTVDARESYEAERRRLLARLKGLS